MFTIPHSPLCHILTPKNISAKFPVDEGAISKEFNFQMENKSTSKKCSNIVHRVERESMVIVNRHY
jgi:hypothetical protein